MLSSFIICHHEARYINQRFTYIPSVCFSITTFFFFKFISVLPFCIFAGFLITYFYKTVYFFVLRSFPRSFTLGEASIICQGFVLLMLNNVLLLIDYTKHRPSSDLQQMTAIVEVIAFVKHFFLL